MGESRGSQMLLNEIERTGLWEIPADYALDLPARGRESESERCCFYCFVIIAVARGYEQIIFQPPISHLARFGMQTKIES